MWVDNECLVYIVCLCVCVCCVCGSLCGPMAPPVHGFMNILLWTKSPCSDAQMDGEGERQLIWVSKDELLHYVVYQTQWSCQIQKTPLLCLTVLLMKWSCNRLKTQKASIMRKVSKCRFLLNVAKYLITFQYFYKFRFHILTKLINLCAFTGLPNATN